MKTAERPWLSEDHDRDHGREEIVGPGGLRPIVTVADGPIMKAQIAMVLASMCESPIEVALGATLMLYLQHTGIALAPQYQWRKFRMDFALVYENNPLLFVECDGKQFHSTPQQIERDRLKDRLAEEAGIPLLRFTGSDIYKSENGCCLIILKRAEHLLRLAELQGADDARRAWGIVQ